ncbi:hypothetical protein GCM10009864_63330 [Streptomyces lunalinharesii]|uniref:Uncharacterized protein n=1 Tax=Streptomyces lunalinharesii TaxID=333384 RepID=A0ABP6F2U5_9ACTN
MGFPEPLGAAERSAVRRRAGPAVGPGGGGVTGADGGTGGQRRQGQCHEESKGSHIHSNEVAAAG